MKDIWKEKKEELGRPLVYLAPMSGVTNRPYRQMVKKFGADLLFPEFISIYALHYGSERTLDMLKYDEIERPIIAQIFGSEPTFFQEAAELCVKLGFDGVDINFGCPAPKVAKNGGGVALLGDLPRSRDIIQATLDGVDGKLPVSVKTRVSYKDTHVREFAELIADMPLANLCIHGRSFERPYLGAADLDCLKEAKEIVPFMVTASGHGHTPEAAKHTLDYTGCDGITLARATFGRPWIGGQIIDYIETGSYQEPTLGEKLDTMLEHARLAGEQLEHRPYVEMRKVLAWYVKGIPYAASYRRELVRVDDYAQVEEIVGRIREEMATEGLLNERIKPEFPH